MVRDYISREAAINKIMGNIVHQDSRDANFHNWIIFGKEK